MPSKAPPSGPKVKQALRQLGRQIRAQRKALKVSAVGASEAAGVSRMTLNRIERGEASVTMGAYLNVILALGLELSLEGFIDSSNSDDKLTVDSKIRISDYPQLKKLAWQLEKSTQLSPQEVLNIYERNWRHIDFKKMKAEERKLLQQILSLFGKEKPLV